MKILMVCLGNICRSPLAQGILEDKVAKNGLSWVVDSAGTSSWHIGDLPDKRSVKIAGENGIDITKQNARQVHASDIEHFDLILAMDQSNYIELKRIFAQKFDDDKIKLIMNFVYPGKNMPVPDPYYDGNFQRVFGLLDQACESIIDQFGTT